MQIKFPDVFKRENWCQHGCMQWYPYGEWTRGESLQFLHFPIFHINKFIYSLLKNDLNEI